MNKKSDPQSTLAEQFKKLIPGSTVISDPVRIAATVQAPVHRRIGQLPNCVVQPANPDDLRSLLVFANSTNLNLTVTSSTGMHRNGGISNLQENVLVDLSTWQKIDLVDRRNRVCRIEPGVNYGQLLAELNRNGMTLPIPLAPRNGKSVVASVMDREPGTWSNKQWDASDPVGSTEFYFASGERFRSGSAGGPGDIDQQRQSGGAQKLSSGPSQADFHRVLQGAQGTLGILTWITLRTELKPSVQKTLLAGSDQLEDLLSFVYATQHGLLGEQVFIMDRTALALLLSAGSVDTFEIIRASLPKYICLQNIAGFERLPGERLAFHLLEIENFASTQHLQLKERIGQVSADELLDKASHPCGEVDWRDQLRGDSLSIFFISTLDRMPGFIKTFGTIAREFGIPETGIGIYIQPINQNHACHIEFILPFESGSQTVNEKMGEVESQAVKQLIQAGAFFSRPYGPAADLVWAQNPGNYQLLKTIKEIFDPGRVLQKDKWGL